MGVMGLAGVGLELYWEENPMATSESESSACEAALLGNAERQLISCLFDLSGCNGGFSGEFGLFFFFDFFGTNTASDSCFLKFFMSVPFLYCLTISSFIQSGRVLSSLDSSVASFSSAASKSLVDALRLVAGASCLPNVLRRKSNSFLYRS